MQVIDDLERTHPPEGTAIMPIVAIRVREGQEVGLVPMEAIRASDCG